MSSEAFLERLRQTVLADGFAPLLGIEPVRCFEGEAERVITLRDDLRQHHGFAHGAVIGAAADSACAWAAASVAGDVVTASYTLHLVAPATGERLRAFGVVQAGGKRQLTVRADVFSEVGDERSLVATALASIARVQAKS
ncbi:MAG: PaaI family thioesterase [Hyphomicrobiaceae bacterium]